MKQRTRTKTRKVAGGVNICCKPTHVQVLPAREVHRKTIVDFYQKSVGIDGLLPASNCTITERKVTTLGRCYGSRPRGLSLWKVNKLPGTIVSGKIAGVSSKLEARDLGDIEYLNRLRARTTPSRTEFSIWVFMREMLEVLTLFSVPAKSIGQLAGGSYLNVEFGWKAFVRDVRTLDGILKAVQSRFRELNTLAEKGGLRRRIPLDSWSISERESEATWESGSGWFKRGIRSQTSTRRVRGVIRWQAHPIFLEELQSLEPFEVWDEAVSYIFALREPNLVDAWNVIPFSWLLDYFVNLNTLLQSVQDSHIFWPTEISLIRETEETVSFSVTPSNSWVEWTPSVIRYSEYKRRMQPTTGFAPSVDLIPNLDQLANIIALALRLRKA